MLGKGINMRKQNLALLVAPEELNLCNNEIAWYSFAPTELGLGMAFFVTKISSRRDGAFAVGSKGAPRWGLLVAL